MDDAHSAADQPHSHSSPNKNPNPNQKHSIILASQKQLEDRAYYVQLWRAVRRLSISRRAWRERLADMLRDYEGELLYAPGVPYQIPFVDDIFGNDHDMRWMGYYLKADASGNHPLIISRHLERLRLLDLYVRIYQDMSE